MHNIEKLDYVGTLKVFKNGFVFAIQARQHYRANTQIEYITDTITLSERLRDINIYGFNYYSYQAPLLYMLQRPHYTPLDVYTASIQLLRDGMILDATWKGGRPGVHLGYDLSCDLAPSMTIPGMAGHLYLPIKYFNDCMLYHEISIDDDAMCTIKDYCDYELYIMQIIALHKAPYIRGTQTLERILNMKSGALGCSCKRQAVALLQARKEPHDREFIPYPKDINILDIPKPIKDHFDKVNKSLYIYPPIKTEYELCGLKVTYGLGGLHGALKNYYTEATNNKCIEVVKVSNLLANILLKYKLLSRNIPADSKGRCDMLKKIFYGSFNINGECVDVEHSNFLLQSVIDGMWDNHSALYDPTRARAIYLYSQLLMTDLILSLSKETKGLKLLLVSTDTIIIEYDTKQIQFYEPQSAWTNNAIFTLSVGLFNKLWIKDEHNYCFETPDDYQKTYVGFHSLSDDERRRIDAISRFDGIGPDLSYGYINDGLERINNNCTCIKTAIRNYLSCGDSIKETIENLPLNTKQIIVSRTKKLETLTTYFKNVLIELPDTVRVFATTNKDCYPIFRKTKDQVVGESVPGCPDHCFVTLDILKDKRGNVLRNDIDGGISVVYEEYARDEDDPTFPVDNSYYIAKAEEWLRPFEENLNK
jgi:hypothetical protein